MNEPFDLPVLYKGEEILFPAQLLQLGYTHKFKVAVNGMEVFFEPDEDRNYRAIIQPEQLETAKIDVALLQAISEAIEAVIK